MCKDALVIPRASLFHSQTGSTVEWFVFGTLMLDCLWSDGRIPRQEVWSIVIPQ